eukprot:CAMPEP_0171677044 /NCGR_PEP_ID=MMETSP0990-20121206/54810_1 /TAXON_ID=483369 /ORGANISM="non described non described, Strain CCMP2098" /LENGTH=77 /DNA_ID=CAMNT_0012263369 /DNA_START=307 /DNA_END=539 /DNA_ORIENTATION=-
MAGSGPFPPNAGKSPYMAIRSSLSMPSVTTPIGGLPRFTSQRLVFSAAVAERDKQLVGAAVLPTPRKRQHAPFEGPT